MQLQIAGTEQQEEFVTCFENWIAQQRQDLEELSLALRHHAHDQTNLRRLVSKNLQHYEEYYESRSRFCRQDAPFFYSPTWCTSFESSFMWIGGCRPTLSIRLIYSLTGLELEAQLSEYLRGVRKGNLGELSVAQLHLVSELQRRTVREEDKLSNRMASLQEDVADQPLVKMAGERSRPPCEEEAEVDRAMEAHAVALAQVLEDADKLRINTLKEVLEILTPLQAVDFLIAAKQLHLSIHDWGKRRDCRHGRT